MAVENMQTYTYFAKFDADYEEHFYINNDKSRELVEQRDYPPYVLDYWSDAGSTYNLNTKSSNLSTLTTNDYIYGNVRVYNSEDHTINLYLVFSS